MTLLRPLRCLLLPAAGLVLAGCVAVPAGPAYPGPVVYGGTMPAPVATYPAPVVGGAITYSTPAPVYYGPPPVFWGPPAPVYVRPPLYYGAPPPYVARPYPHYRGPHAGAPAARSNGSIGSAIDNVRKRSQQ